MDREHRSHQSSRPTGRHGFQAQLERALIDEFLRTHGYDPANVSGPPNAELELLMKQAYTYASGKLAEVEARAHFVHDIHGGVEDVHKTRHR